MPLFDVYCVAKEVVGFINVFLDATVYASNVPKELGSNCVNAVLLTALFHISSVIIEFGDKFVNVINHLIHYYRITTPNGNTNFEFICKPVIRRGVGL